MDHHSVAYVDAHVACAYLGVGVLEEDDVAWLCFAGAYVAAVAAKAFCRGAANVADGMIDHPAHEAGAVEARRRRRAASDVGVSQVLLSLLDHRRELGILESFGWDGVA